MLFNDERFDKALHNIEAYFPSQAAKTLGETYDFGDWTGDVKVHVLSPDGSESDYLVTVLKQVYVRPAERN